MNSENEIEVLRKNADTFQKYIIQNEQLKTEIGCLIKKNKKLKAENDRLKAEFKIESLTDKRTGETIYRSNLVNKYRIILQEIKAIAENCMTKDICYECKYTDDCYIEDAEIPTYDICKLLIQKITKAEEE